MRLLPDVPVIIVLLHLAMLTALLIHGAVIQLRRFILMRQRRSLPDTPWSHLLQVLLGLTK
jgi:hypothetical protein